MDWNENTVPNQAQIDLIVSTELGSNGARYQHLDVLEQLNHIDNPLFISLSSRERCFANITLCQRPQGLYLRYFCFQAAFQSRSGTKAVPKDSQLRTKIKEHLQELITRKGQPIYGFIEDANIRSQKMAEFFGFKEVGALLTYHFFRLNPKKSVQFIPLNRGEAQSYIKDYYGKRPMYFQNEASGSFYAWTCGGKIKYIARFHTATWKVLSLQGNFARKFLKALPYIPLLNRVIQPDKHRFIAMDSFVSLMGVESDIHDFISSALAHFNSKHLMYWEDVNTTNGISRVVRWGWLNRLLGKNRIKIMVKGQAPKLPIYIDAMDLI